MPTTLVLGGPRSGRTRHAISLLREHGRATYVITGDDRPVGAESSAGPEGSAGGAEGVGAPPVTRLPSSWETVRTGELTRTLLSARGPVLIDGLTGWVRSQLDKGQLWDEPALARERICSLLAELAVAAAAVPVQVVLVGQDLSTATLSEEPHHRLLVELTAEANTQLSAACRRVHVVLAGRVLDLSDAPVVR